MNDRRKEKNARWRTHKTVCGAVDRKKRTSSRPLHRFQCQPNPLKSISRQNPNVVWIEGQAKYYRKEVAKWQRELKACELAKTNLAKAKTALKEAIKKKAAKKKQM